MACYDNQPFRDLQVLGYIKHGLPNSQRKEMARKTVGKALAGEIIAEADKIWQELEVSF
jgi:hypothetical protein